MKKICCTGIASDNYYQLYLPLFTYILNKEYPEYEVKTFIKGNLNAINKKIYSKFNLVKPISIFKEIPEKRSTINCLRFLVPERHFKNYKYVIFLDVDLLIFRTTPTLFQWHKQRMKDIGSCYAGHHGPWKKRHRPKIAPRGWKGDYERVAGGLFMATHKWFKKTKSARNFYLDLARKRKLGGYREADEVMLCNILKKSNIPVPPMGFTRKLRGVHLGDFKSTMRKRYNSKSKMTRKVSRANAKKFLEYQNDAKWLELCSIVEQNKYIANIAKRATKILTKRIEWKK